MPSHEAILKKLESIDMWYRTELEQREDKRELRREYLTKKWLYLCETGVITWGQWEEWKYNKGKNELK